MENQGYKKFISNYCVFIEQLGENDFVVLLLYVDDVLIIEHDNARIPSLKMAMAFAVKDLGQEKSILRMPIHHDEGVRKLWMLQEKYIEKVLKWFNIKDAS